MWTIQHVECMPLWMHFGNGSLMVINGHVPYNISIYACNHIVKPIQSVALSVCEQSDKIKRKIEYEMREKDRERERERERIGEYAFMLAHNKQEPRSADRTSNLYIAYIDLLCGIFIFDSLTMWFSLSLTLWVVHPAIVHIFHYDYVLRLVQTVTDEPINYFFRNSVDDISTHTLIHTVHPCIKHTLLCG